MDEQKLARLEAALDALDEYVSKGGKCGPEHSKLLAEADAAAADLGIEVN